MIDLDKEKMIITKETLSSYSVGWNDGIDNLKLKYNIITAPKTIKLSEIVSKLNEKHKQTINGKVVYEYKVNRNGWHNTDGTLYHLTNTTIDNYYYGERLSTIINFNLKMAITAVNADYFGEKYKWLYTLWIAGTIIEDDLQEE